MLLRAEDGAVREPPPPPEVTESKRLTKEVDKQRRRVIKDSRAEAERDADAARKGKMGPTPQRDRHGKMITTPVVSTEDEQAPAGARVYRTQSPIERYAKRGSLTGRQSDAADDLRADWEFGVQGANVSGRTGNGGGVVGYTHAQLQAATNYREAVQAMGQRVCAVVLPVVIGTADGGEITVEMLARQRGDDDRKHVMGMLRLGLDVLGDHYKSCSDRRRAAKYA